MIFNYYLFSILWNWKYFLLLSLLTNILQWPMCVYVYVFSICFIWSLYKLYNIFSFLNMEMTNKMIHMLNLGFITPLIYNNSFSIFFEVYLRRIGYVLWRNHTWSLCRWPLSLLLLATEVVFHLSTKWLALFSLNMLFVTIF